MRRSFDFTERPAEFEEFLEREPEGRISNMDVHEFSFFALLRSKRMEKTFVKTVD
jgi:hypothetical protein